MLSRVRRTKREHYKPPMQKMVTRAATSRTLATKNPNVASPSLSAALLLDAKPYVPALDFAL
ncbi:MAG: hypothetical protein DUD27_06760 [Lachnospiraceae bacterium]|nr:MAG: hypothetical protein DUD27_06760 [Lachnospiraceae bacterium]